MADDGGRARLTGAVTGVTVVAQPAPQRADRAAEVVRHEAVDERVDRALDVRQQVNH